MNKLKFRFFYDNGVGFKIMEYAPDIREWACRGLFDIIAGDFYTSDRCMHCTGLKDSDGKLIYEGDILENEISGGCCQVYGRPEQGGFMTAPINKFNHVPLFGNKLHAVLRDYPDYSIIGNIHENPALLNRTF